MLDVVVFYDDPGPVPFEASDLFALFVFRSNEIEEGSECPVVFDGSGIGIELIIEYLVFASNGRTFAIVVFRIDEVLDSAVAGFCEFEMDLQFEVLEFVDGYNVTA